MSAKFIIVGAPRTGSTLLVRTLNSLEGVCCHGELLGPENVRGYEDGFDLLSATKEERDARAARLVQERDGDPAGFIEKALGAGSNATGFKALYSSFANPRWHAVTQSLLAGGDIRFIHLVRENTLRRYISEAVFQAGGPNHSAEGGRADVRVKIAVDIDALAVRCDEIEAQASGCLARLAKQEVLDISYEELAADLGATVARVCAFLGITVEQSHIKPALQKVGFADLRETVSNYQELIDNPLTKTLALRD